MKTMKLDKETLFYGYFPPYDKYLYRLLRGNAGDWKSVEKEYDEEIPMDELQDRVISPMREYLNNVE